MQNTNINLGIIHISMLHTWKGITGNSVIYFDSNLLDSIFKAEFEHCKSVESLQGVMKHLLSLLASEVPSAIKTSFQYFSLLYNYCQQVNTDIFDIFHSLILCIAQLIWSSDCFFSDLLIVLESNNCSVFQVLFKLPWFMQHIWVFLLKWNKGINSFKFQILQNLITSKILLILGCKSL